MLAVLKDVVGARSTRAGLAKYSRRHRIQCGWIDDGVMALLLKWPEVCGLVV